MQLSEFERQIVEHLLKASPPGKHACRSAVRYLERAWLLADTMPELAFFCGITAEEESATALFQVLKKHRYVGAKGLNPWRHEHKAALHPFLVSVGRFVLPHIDMLNPGFVFDIDDLSKGKERLQLALDIGIPNKRAYALPPLSLRINADDVSHYFESELESELANLASENGAKPIFDLVKDRANFRNQILYAAPSGIPQINKDAALPFLLDCKTIVFSHFIAFLLIDPYSKQQPFVQQCLNAFLQMLKVAPKIP
jgi:hypothetical protein